MIKYSTWNQAFKMIPDNYREEVVETMRGLERVIGEEVYIFNPEFLGYLLLALNIEGWDFMVRTTVSREGDPEYYVKIFGPRG